MAQSYDVGAARPEFPIAISKRGYEFGAPFQFNLRFVDLGNRPLKLEPENMAVVPDSEFEWQSQRDGSAKKFAYFGCCICSAKTVAQTIVA
ncbi:hypothetical protein FGK63_02300 [Ruegeria sediminis]|uniref:Uncharacterized protein n=1 Tax=Ruegeria sediminis TaxID=2583820 RepID=A0ABY2X4C1_9RHOB|nr:hypothetical protein [Ruegeria sediminis]TMV09923.1 hypothetical protein FGK63_02300 [Ruegeria sediminis]